MSFWHRNGFVIEVTGTQAHHLLNVLLTQQLDGLTLPAAREWLWLEAKGAIVAAGTLILADDEQALLWVDERLGETVVQRLHRFKFSLKATITPRPDLVVISEPDNDHPGIDQYPVLTQDELGWRVAYPYGWADRLINADLLAQREASGEMVVAADDFESTRINAGVPAWEREIIAGTRAQELGLLPTHGHMKKGCYPGQESIAKIYNLGEVRRKLCLLSTPEPVAVGSVIEQRRPAPITSATDTHALAFVSLNDGELPTDIACGDHCLSVVRAVGSQWEIPEGWRNVPQGPETH